MPPVQKSTNVMTWYAGSRLSNPNVKIPLGAKNLCYFYFLSNFVKPHSVLKNFGLHVPE